MCWIPNSMSFEAVQYQCLTVYTLPSIGAGVTCLTIVSLLSPFTEYRCLIWWMYSIDYVKKAGARDLTIASWTFALNCNVVFHICQVKSTRLTSSLYKHFTLLVTTSLMVHNIIFSIQIWSFCLNSAYGQMFIPFLPSGLSYIATTV